MEKTVETTRRIAHDLVGYRFVGVVWGWGSGWEPVGALDGLGRWVMGGWWFSLGRLSETTTAVLRMDYHDPFPEERSLQHFLTVTLSAARRQTDHTH
jgi:hypothetical protein